MPEIKPFKISIPQRDIDDLTARIAHVRLPSALPGDELQTGLPVSEVARLLDLWSQHDWRATETRLNKIPQFLAEIDGQDIHFFHVKSAHAGATPLMLIHGWPGSVLEFEHLIGPLTDPTKHGGSSEDAFDLVIPALPGFGFSTPLNSEGWTTTRIATVFADLMNSLGYESYMVQGGDIGAGVAPEMGRVALEHVIAVHVNGALGGFVSEVDEKQKAKLTPFEQDRLRRVGEFMQKEFGYISLQSTRPGLVGEMLVDSPAAQFAWIYDKLQAWSWPEEKPAAEILGSEFVFANASLYWFTKSAGSAAYVGYAQQGLAG
ncbi:epoxide hydrolase family protein [Devosia aurantiaca]|uniref:epoxide hydrolase family protein n=1 Tax=Devosia aurantiaca TaxID=2714858 RepID=UPI001A99C6FC|nr:epoxide hydrolase [Devosia aurantiaca]